MMRQRGGRQVRLRVLAAVICMLGITGCQYTATPADLLLGPRDTPENAELAAAVREALPARAKLSLPDQDEAMSAVRKADVDGDGSKEAIVTFINEAEEQQVLLLKEGVEGWRLWFTFGERSSYGIDWIDVTDLDGDGNPEMLIGWNQYEMFDRTLNVYQIRPQEEYKTAPRPIAELSYSKSVLGDIDGNGRDEIVLIREEQLGKEDQLFGLMDRTLHVYRLERGSIANTETAALSSEVNGYYNLVVGKIAENRYGIVADAGLGAHSSMTIMLAWENGRLVQVYPMRGSEYDSSFNVYSTESGDGNSDGILEIQVLKEAMGQPSNATMSELVLIEQWKQWDGKGDFHVVMEQYADYSKRYAIRFPEKWYDQVTVRRPEGDEKGQLYIEIYEEASGKRLPLFVIHSTPLGDWNALEQAWKDQGVRYSELAKGAGMVHAAEWEEPMEDWTAEELALYNDLQLNGDELKRLFKLLPEN
ncbi:FG-GAP repeat domain-containing protein [Paenibacillus spongiae]|uniref:VCBS repeat-containing protein n=1 Tax=Paenibacillus spongiae TaxID=2909671 RepID=A0ABY5SAG4_9BACL|nr:VCBS repeat-containing protein [Paenibacillus spongiae]UVI30926.1 VCBS repeat-containing protein [Paenibacillus spongiae]